MSPVFTLILLASAAYYWWLASQAKESAIRAGRIACQRSGVQFLDDTVEQRRVRLRRGANGTLTFWRYYVFEFSVDGGKRYQGRLILMGERVMTLEMDAYRLSDNVVQMPQ